MSVTMGYNLEHTLKILYFPDYAPMAEFSITRLYYMIKQWDYNCRIARIDNEPIYDLG